jgi:hypothetical protein
MLHQDELADEQAVRIEADVATTLQRYAAAAIDEQGAIWEWWKTVNLSAQRLSLAAAFNRKPRAAQQTAAQAAAGSMSSASTEQLAVALPCCCQLCILGTA